MAEQRTETTKVESTTSSDTSGLTGVKPEGMTDEEWQARQQGNGQETDTEVTDSQVTSHTETSR